MTGLHFWTTLALLAAAQSYPPPFPRPNATKLLENERVVVWDVVWPKGQPTALHRHLYDLAGVYYASGERLITDADGSKRTVQTKAGGVTAQNKGLTHIEEGTSDAPLRAVMIEMKEAAADGRTWTAPADAPPAFGEMGAKQLLDNPRVMAWTYSYGFGNEGPRHRHDRDAVVVWVEGPKARAAFVPAGTMHTEEQTGATSPCTVFELK